MNRRRPLLSLAAMVLFLALSSACTRPDPTGDKPSGNTPVPGLEPGRFKAEHIMKEGSSFSGVEVDKNYLSELGLKDLSGSVMYYIDTGRMKAWLVTTVDNPEHAGVKMAYWFGDPIFSQRFYVALIDDYSWTSRLSISYEDTIEGSTGFNLLPNDTLFLNVRGEPNLFMTPDFLLLTSGNDPEGLQVKLEKERNRITLNAETFDLSALNVMVPNLPRSPEGLPPNSLWVDGDVVKVSR